MQLPSTLQHFPSPTLIVATDTVFALFFLVQGDSIEELERIHVPHEKKQDTEGEVFSPGTGAAVGLSELKDEHQQHEFIGKIVDRLKHLISAHAIKHIHLVMPAQMEHMLTAHLPKELEQQIMWRVHLDLVKSSPVEIVERLLADRV